MSARRTIFWDFDYTLGFRGAEASDEHRHPWGYCLLDILDREEPGHGATLETIRSHFRNGFPWHRPEEPHAHAGDPDAWWSSLEPMFGRALAAAGLRADRAARLASEYRHHFVDVTAWSLYPDTIDVLHRLADDGWSHAIESNHVPELIDIVTGLGLTPLVEHVVCSAVIGYEKPNPETFRWALRQAGHPDRVWMVGDNPLADVHGAEAVGIPAIQVRMRRGEGVRRYAPDLLGVVGIVSASTEPR